MNGINLHIEVAPIKHFTTQMSVVASTHTEGEGFKYAGVGQTLALFCGKAFTVKRFHKNRLIGNSLRKRLTVQLEMPYPASL